MLKIGDFSKMGKTTVKTLRYYDAIGLLRPKQIDRGERIPLVFHGSADRVGSDSTMAAAGTQRGYDRQNSA